MKVDEVGAASVRALAHPTRLKLIALLRAEGPLAATRAAQLLGEEAGGGHGRQRPWRATAASTAWPSYTADPELAIAFPYQRPGDGPDLERETGNGRDG